MWFFETPATILLLIVSIIITAVAQVRVSSAYSKYKKVKSYNKMTGQEVARMILDRNGLEDVYIVKTRGELTDHYDPRRKVIRLSNSIYDGDSIAAVSVAAHECGHAIQDKDGYMFMRIRSMLIPVVNFMSYAAYFVILISIFAGATGYLTFGIIALLITLLFQLVTLPVEFNASTRAKAQLANLGVVRSDEEESVKKMLGAAAMTYVASLLTTIIQILRLVIMLGDRD